MPRPAVFRTSTLEGLFESLKARPLTQRKAALDAAEELVWEIEPSSGYPAEFVRWRLLGDRVPDDSAPLSGDALLGDLGILVQRLTEDSPVDASTDPDGALDMHEAAAALEVSVRTLQRWRARGLVFPHVRFPDGQVRLGVLQGALRRFRERGGSSVQRATGFTRITAEEEHQLLERANALMAQGHSLNQAALEVSGGSARAHETIRQLIRRHRGQRGPVRGFGGRVRERERALVLKAFERGLECSTIAFRIGRSTPSTRRIGAEARAERLRRLRPVWIEMPAFEQEDAEHVLLGARDVVHGPEPSSGPVSVFELVESLRRGNAHPEALLLPAMHLQLRSAARQIDVLPRTPPVGRLDEIETGLRRADRLWRRVVESVLGAAFRRVEQHIAAPLTDLDLPDLERWFAFCVQVVTSTIDGFDPTARGELEPRLDRFVALETDKLIVLREREVARSSKEGGAPLEPASMSFARFPQLLLPPRLQGRMDRLDAEGSKLVTARYGLSSEHPLTIAELADRSSVSRRAISSMISESLRQLHRPEGT